MEILKFIFSWSHIISASLSMLFGLILVTRTKGDKKHKKMGDYYFYAMLINNITALFIYNAYGKWFFPHWLAVITLALIIPGFLSIRMSKSSAAIKVHIISMVLSYYMLIGGAVNEAFIHIPSLTPLMHEQSPAFGMTHFAVQIIFVAMLIYFLIRYRKMGRKIKA